MERMYLLEDAIVFAAQKHKGQVRKGNKMPYIIHPMRVLHNLLAIKESKNIMIMSAAAILHDTVEDCGVKIQEIAKRFGYQVAALVEELTLDKTQYEKIGKAVYLADHMLKMSSYALNIKLSDRLDNIEDTKTMSSDFTKKYIAETNYILEKLKGRKLTKTHLKQIAKLRAAIKKAEKYVS